MANDPVEEWKSKVTKLNVGEKLAYHRGHLAADAERSVSLRNIQIFVYGLYLMGRIGLRQQTAKVLIGRDEVDSGLEERHITTYSFKVLQPVSRMDFDTARKAFLDSVAV